jgi:AraC-like DNA-binding protein
VRFDARLLDRRGRRGTRAPLLTFEDLARLRFEPASVGDFTGAVTALVWAQVLAGTPSIENAARSLDTSVRTLQRELNRDGIDFRGLVRLVRIRRARELLTETGATIGEIASELGYSSSANFSRAFRNATGTTPQAFRSSLATGA